MRAIEAIGQAMRAREAALRAMHGAIRREIRNAQARQRRTGCGGGRFGVDPSDFRDLGFEEAMDAAQALGVDGVALDDCAVLVAEDERTVALLERLAIALD